MPPADPLDDGISLSADKAESVIRLKVVGTFDEPLELSPEQARDLAQRLTELADALD